MHPSFSTVTAFKLAATPLLVLIATLIIRRWGASVGGLMAGIPIMTGPIMIFIAMEQGTEFAVAAVPAVLIAAAGAAMFSATFALVGPFARWPGTLFAALAAWLGTAAGLSAFEPSIPVAALAGWACLGVALLVIPKPRGPVTIAGAPWWDLPFRMVVTGTLVGAVTWSAPDLGPHLSGLVGTIPLISTVLASFTLHQSGSRAVAVMLRAQSLSMIGFVVFFLIVATLLEPAGIVVTFATALAVTLAVSLVATVADRRVGRWSNRRAVGEWSAARPADLISESQPDRTLRTATPGSMPSRVR